ncbi:T9SS type A sorting domain-containing protein, partial [Mangrovimonas sp. CR14]
GPSGYVGYSWSFGGSEVGTSEDLTITGATSADAGVYTLTVTDNNGCSGSDTATVTVYDNPEPSVGDASDCEGEDITLDGPSGYVGYSWSFGGSEVGTSEDLTITGATSADAGVYTLTVTDNNGCSGSDTATVTVYDNPEPSVGDASDCEGEDITLDGPSGYVGYSWSFGGSEVGTSEDLTITGATSADAGVYTLTVTDNNGCSGSDTATVTVYDNPPCDISGPTEVCLQSPDGSGYVYSFEGDATGLTFEWTVNGGTIIGADNGTSVEVLFDSEGNNKVWLTVTNGTTNCTSTCSYDVMVYDCCSDETAYAYNTQCTGVDNLCFLDYEDELNENRWGWTLSGIDLESDISDDLGIQYNSYTVDLYAGNGNDCMPTDGPGQYVGTATITRNGDDITVSYNLIDDTEDTYYALYGLHVNIGCYQFALKPKGKKKMVNTVAPGQYNASGSGNGSSEGVVTIDVDDTVKDGNQYCLDNLYVIVHAEVEICTTEPMTSTPTAVRLVETAKVEPIQNETVAVDFKAYPVPFKDIVNISYRFDFDTKVTLEIIDLSGRLVYTKNIQNYVKGTNGMETIDLTKTNSQMLFVRLITDQGIKIKKIVAK